MYTSDVNEVAPPANHHQCGAEGIWVYVCSQCLALSGHMAPPPVTIRQPNAAPKCCHSTGDQSINTDSPKKPKKFSMDNKPTVRLYCKSLVKYSLTICDGKLTLAPTNPCDPHQHWMKEEQFGEDVKDEEGHSSFALINKATGQTLKHSIGLTYPVQLIKYDPDKLDESVLWTRGMTLKEGYTAIRSVYNIHLNLDAYESTKDLERTEIRQYGWNGGNNQQWSLAFF